MKITHFIKHIVCLLCVLPNLKLVNVGMKYVKNKSRYKTACIVINIVHKIVSTTNILLLETNLKKIS